MRVPLQFVARDPSPVVLAPVWFSADGDPDNGRQSSSDDPKANPKSGDLPYRIELWDAERQAVETVLAVTARSAIGYAAYYAAVKEYPDRLVTLRHKNRTIARSSEPKSSAPNNS